MIKVGMKPGVSTKKSFLLFPYRSTFLSDHNHLTWPPGTRLGDFCRIAFSAAVVGRIVTKAGREAIHFSRVPFPFYYFFLGGSVGFVGFGSWKLFFLFYSDVWLYRYELYPQKPRSAWLPLSLRAWLPRHVLAVSPACSCATQRCWGTKGFAESWVIESDLKRLKGSQRVTFELIGKAESFPRFVCSHSILFGLDKAEDNAE